MRGIFNLLVGIFGVSIFGTWHFCEYHDCWLNFVLSLFFYFYYFFKFSFMFLMWGILVNCRILRAGVVLTCWSIGGWRYPQTLKMSLMKLTSEPFSDLSWITTSLNIRVFNCLSHCLSDSWIPLVPFIFRALARWYWHHMTSQPSFAWNWVVRELRVMIPFH